MAKRSKRKNVADGEVSAKAADPVAATQPPPSWFNRDWLWGLILFLAVILTYSPVWWAGYVWDDAGYVNVNTYIVGPLGLKEIWTTSAADISPLAKTTFWVEHALWGLAPLPYHLVNVLLHGACAVVLWQVLRTLKVPGAWLGAALWALHPVEVESVAWISEMKNTESGLFFLLSIFFFVKWLRTKDSDERTGTGWNYTLTLIFAALAMASKSSTVILPVILCLCAWWMEGRWQWRNLVNVGPIFLMSIAAAAASIWTQGLLLAKDTDPQFVRSWPERLATAGDAVWFYLGKLLWPHPLITVYPRWQIDAGQWFSYVPLLAVMVILFMLWLKRESWARPWFFVFAYFLAALLPVLGLVDNFIFRYSLVFDHFQYLASMGPMALAGAGLVRLADFVIPGRLRLQLSLGAGLLLVLGLWSWQRAWAYESQETLWTDTLAKNPNCWVGYNNLGNVLVQKGRGDEGIAQYEKALEINPNYAAAYNNLSVALLQKGQVDEAMTRLQKALEIDPNDEDARYNLGLALAKKGQADEAMAQYKKVVEINPNYAPAHDSLGHALLQKGQVNEAIIEYQKALEIDPSYAPAYYSLGLALAKKGQADEAMVQYQEAVKINPNIAEPYNNLGRALVQRGQVNEAIIEYQKAFQINPNDAEAHNNLGNALLQKGQADEAMVQYQEAVKINPNIAEPYNNLGRALVQRGQVNEAIIEYQKALQINPNDAEAYSNLGGAFLQKGQVDEAMTRLQKALRIDPNNADAHNNLGIVFAHKGRMEEAIAQFQEALQLKSNFIDAQNNLAKVQAMARQSPGSK